jgi:hypothetical protein
MIAQRWTKPYHGVQHLEADLTPLGVRQVTVDDLGSCAIVYALPLAGFTPFWEETLSNAAAARKAAETRFFAWKVSAK